MNTPEKRKLTHEQRLELLPQTLKAFHARHGHFIMHFGSVVPTHDDSDVYPDVQPYPDAARGLELGTTLHWLLVNAKTRPKHVDTIRALDAIGFPVDVDWEQYVWEHQRLPGLRVYQELYGDLRVPTSFVVPTGDKRWPIETWGLKLGFCVANIKHRDHRGLPRKHLEDLDQLNASWRLKKLTHAERLALLAPTLKVFHAKSGHFLMPFAFVVPEDQNSEDGSDEGWPLRAGGEMLGQTLHAFIKSESQRVGNPDVVRALADIGFPVNMNNWDQYIFERQPLAAFRVYRELHDDCLVPQSFVVPTGDPKWPIETWGFHLGIYTQKFRHERHRLLSHEQLDALEELGLSWNLNNLSLNERLPLLAPTLRAFHARRGHFIMPPNYVVPKDDDSDANPHVPPYPTEARGANLGTTLHRFLVSEQRRQKHPSVLQELKEVGFPVDVDWKEYVFERQRLAAFRVYVEIHGDCLVPQSFVVPTGDPKWPIETWGQRLGQYVNALRRRYHRHLTPHQLNQLDELGFWWGRGGETRSEKALPVAEFVEQK
jgi:hypothetical protein